MGDQVLGLYQEVYNKLKEEKSMKMCQGEGESSSGPMHSRTIAVHMPHVERVETLESSTALTLMSKFF